MAIQQHADFVTEAIRTALQHRTRIIVAEEAEKAAKVVASRVTAEADQIALTLLREYDVRMQSEHVVITVRKGA